MGQRQGRARLWVAAVAVVIAAVVAGATVLAAVARMRLAAEDVNGREAILRKVDLIAAATWQAEAEARAFVLTGELGANTGYRAAVRDAWTAWSEGSSLAKAHDAQALFQDLQRALTTRIDLLDTVVDAKTAGDAARADELLRTRTGASAADDVHETLDALLVLERTYLTQVDERFERDSRLVAVVAVVAIASILMTALVGGVFALRRARRDARRDPLTGLANRARLDAQLQALARDRRRGASAVILFIDLDRFKAVNDTFGHDVGDHLLQAVARRLLSVVRAHDLVARIGGDEFVVIADLPAATSGQGLAARVEALLSGPYELDGHHVEIGASVGVCPITPRRQVAEMVTEADQRMYEHKQLHHSDR